MKKNNARTPKVKGKKIGKTTIKRAGATAGKGMFKIPTPLLNKLTAKAEADKKFKGNNASRYAIHVLKEFVAND